MRRWLLVTLVLLATTTMRPDAQPGSPVVLDQSAIRVQSNGNELIARREAPVTYSTLEQIATSITATVATREVPVRIVRASPPQEIDYLFCVTSGGTLVLGDTLKTNFDRLFNETSAGTSVVVRNATGVQREGVDADRGLIDESLAARVRTVPGVAPSSEAIPLSMCRRAGSGSSTSR